MFSKWLHKASIVFLMTLTVIGFQNCGKTQFTVDENALNLKSGDSGDPGLVPTQDTGGTAVGGGQTPVAHDPLALAPPAAIGLTVHTPEGAEADAYSGACQIFKNIAMPLVIPDSAQDININGSAGNLDISLARFVNIQKIAGHILIKAAERITQINGAAGGVQANANQIESISNLAGAVCIRAIKVGRISNTAGGTKVIASEIDEISNTAGLIHVYGGVVKLVSNNAGGICLHDGAKVLNYSNVAGFVGDCK